MSEIDDICQRINFLSTKLQEKINEKLLEIEKKENEKRISSEQNIVIQPAGVRICRWDITMINWTNSLRSPPFY